MYNNRIYQNYPNNYHGTIRSNNYGNRLIGGGFLAPFVLGGITGGLLAPAFYPRPYPIYPAPYPPYQPYPMYPY